MLNKLIMFTLMSSFLASCGQKSVIKQHVATETFAQAYGDGKYLSRPFVIPIADLDAVDSPMPELGLVFGGLTKMFMNVGASMGMGRFRMTLEQPMPEDLYPEYLKEVRIKRVFFYIEPKEKGRRKFSWFNKIFKGKSNVDFDFLDKIAIKMKPMKFDHVESFIPVSKFVDLDQKTTNRFLDLFKEKDNSQFADFLDTELEKEPVILKYDKTKKASFIKNGKYGQMYMVSTTDAADLKQYFLKHEKLKGFFSKIHALKDIILIQLNKDPVLEEKFMAVMEEDAGELDMMGVTQIDECNPDICLDLNVRDVNLMPILLKENGILIDGFINAKEVPASFQLKGFIEFEVKVQTPNGT